MEKLMPDGEKFQKLENELELMKGKYHALLRNMRESVAIYKAVDNGNDFVFTYLNPSGELTENISSDQILGKKVTEVFPGIIELGLFTQFQEVWKTGKAIHYPTHLYEDNHISGWRDNFIFKLPDGEIVSVYLDKTEEKKVNEELELTKALLTQTIQQNPIGFAILDAKSGDFISINKVALNLLGLEVAHDFNIKDVDRYWDIFDETGNQILAEELPLPRALQGLITENQSMIIKRLSDGVKFWCEASAGPVYNTSNELIAASLSINNISENISLQNKIEMLVKFPDENLNPVIRITTEGKVLFHNKASDRLLESWEISENFIRNPDILTLLQSGANSSQTQSLDVNTGDFIYSVFFVPIANTSYINVYGMDITQREQINQELLESRSRYFNLFNNMLDGFAYHKIILDSSGKPIDYEYIDINPAFTQLLGLTREMCIGKRVTEIIPNIEDDPADWIGTFGNVALTGKSHPFESFSEALDKTFAVSAYRPEPNHFVAVFKDISESVKAQEEIKVLNENLEQRVKDRTARLTAVNEELEAFSYSVSHDLRAPLRGIDGFSQAVLEDYGDKIDETGQDYLHRVRAGVQRMGDLINDMLQLSRLTRTQMRHTSTNLSDMVEKVVADLQTENPARKIEISIEKDLIEKCDFRLMQNVIQNLVGNAWKFTRKTDPAKIEFGRKKDKDQNVYYLRDNGAGFDMTYVKKLFGSFQRLHSNYEFEGSGIGLAIVQRIIHKHGGKVWAEGVVGEGATFYFTLP